MERKVRPLAVMIVALVATAAPSGAVDAPRNGRIAFVKNVNNGETNVASFSGSGRNFEKITRSDANELYVDTSPTGDKVAFTRFTRRGGEIFTASIHGGDVIRVTDNRVHEELPAWSPDGSRIAFLRFPKGEEDAEIFVIDRDGTNLVRVTDNETSDADPRWSPDGTRLAFNGGDFDAGTQEIYVVTVGDPSSQTAITDPGFNDTFGEWSPDGTQIAYASYRDDQWDIFTASPDGGPSVRLTTDPADDFEPQWSFDGSRLLFIRGRLEGELPRDEVYVMNSDGSAQQSVSPPRLRAFSPDWAPNGEKIVFIGQVDTASSDLPEWEIFTVRRDGTQLDRLTTTRAEEFDPEWASR